MAANEARASRRPLGAVLSSLPRLPAPAAPQPPVAPAPAPAPTAPPPAPAGRTRNSLYDTLRTILTPGTEGPDVLDIQRKLIGLKLLDGPATGKYDAATEEAVRKFQASRAIEINGRVGPFTKGHLDDAVAIYGIGSQGPGVATLQKHLRTLGHLKADATGLFDAATEQAVLAFQNEHQIEPTGKVGPTTREFIAEVMAERAEIDKRYAQHRELLARAIAAEARGEPFAAKVAVAGAILNYARMHDVPLRRLVRSSYLSSNYDHNARFYTMPATRIANWAECFEAAGEALASRAGIGNRSHFTDDSIGPPAWVDRRSGQAIGRMIFYRGRR